MQRWIWSIYVAQPFDAIGFDPERMKGSIGNARDRPFRLQCRLKGVGGEAGERWLSGWFRAEKRVVMRSWRTASFWNCVLSVFNGRRIALSDLNDKCID